MRGGKIVSVLPPEKHYVYISAFRMFKHHSNVFL